MIDEKVDKPRRGSLRDVMVKRVASEAEKVTKECKEEWHGAKRAAKCRMIWNFRPRRAKMRRKGQGYGDRGGGSETVL